ncbi:hypothetical protein C2845_PM06G22660 [Panicum miliaceum]|uniref:Isoamylase 1-3-like C-terminal domain-containing protein n=1 Tax=Panicum miliaceum TaxID=4540 RepID=A0A3L6R7T3_PANMI|nr:hypothetical protein C2845_PM06G22660 [Panicum miliaceum]
MAYSLPAPPAPPPASWRGGLPPRCPPPRCGPLLARAAAARSWRYRFRTDDDGVVDVAVAGKDGGAGYAVAVEVPGRGREGGLVLRAAGSGEGVPLAPAPAPGGALAAELSYDGARAPFHVSFLLADAAGAKVRTHRGTSFRVPVGVGRGRPAPLGLSLSEDGAANFAVYSKSAKGVVLCLFHGRGAGGDERARPVIGNFVPDDTVNVDGHSVPSIRCLASLENAPGYNWGRDKHPCLPLEKLVVYRANVDLFTKDKSSGLPDNVASTFSGLAAKVLLEVVFTHTAEGGAECQMMSIRGIDGSSYYIADGIVGCKASVLNCNHPVTQKLILDSLRHWVLDFHVDGFSFINAPFLVRDPGGDGLPRPPLLEAIAFDPVLSKTKIIADPWSPLDISNVQFPFPHWKRWAEINTRFSMDVHKFLKGEALISDLATRLCGSGDLFSSRGPAFSFNYVSRNSGLTLVDLVSFSSDELGSEFSWNCGEEGPSENNAVLQTRLRQIRSFLFILFVSLGIPVLNMGDECGHSAAGSTSYKDRGPLNWKAMKTMFVKEVTGFISFLSALRSRRADIFQRREFLKLENIHWYGSDLSEPRWEDPTSNFLCMHINPELDENVPDSVRDDLYICFNANEESVSATLPALAEGSMWLRLVDTSLAFPGFFSSESSPKVHQVLGFFSYQVKAHSCVLFESKRVLS